jgi:hypothetical protein
VLVIGIVMCGLKAGISESERASIARQRLGKQLFSQQHRGRFHDNERMNCSTRCPLFGTPSRQKTEFIRE